VVGEREELPLIEGGANISLTIENREQYVKAVAEIRLYKAVDKQLDAFRKGFTDVISIKKLQMFTSDELDLLIAGIAEIDIDDLERHLAFTNYPLDSPVIQWLLE
jgi:atrophin-1 interacting protein 4